MSTSTPLTTRPSPLAWAALVLAALTSAGGFYLSLGEGKFPCPLCFYQRSFALATFGVLLVGLLADLGGRVPVATLALPPAAAGLAVALWHAYLVRAGALECPSGAFGISSAPYQSTAAFGLLFVVLLLDAGRAVGVLPAAGAVAVGLLLGAVCSYPPLNPQPKRPTPAQEYEEAPRICRPPQAPAA